MNLAARWLAACALLLAATVSRAADAPQVPLVPGVLVMFAVTEPAGDFEPVLTVRSVTPDYYEALFTSDTIDARTHRRRPIEIPRRVRLQDHRASHTILSEFWEGDPLTFSGTVPFLSRAIIEELRRGSTEIIDRHAVPMFGIPIKHERKGTLTRVAFEKLAVLVNGRMTDLRVIRARGELRDTSTNERRAVEMVALDDLEYPLFLKWREPGRDSRIVRINFPEPSVAQARLEAALAKREPLDVYNVYFEFASAALRPLSKPALDDIAAVLARHPDWKLRIDGHTDDIGDDASNLKLSQQRANAVRDALTRDYRIAADRLSAGGSGEGGAVAPNDTPEGRARNRRVVLSRG